MPKVSTVRLVNVGVDNLFLDEVYKLDGLHSFVHAENGTGKSTFIQVWHRIISPNAHFQNDRSFESFLSPRKSIHVLMELQLGEKTAGKMDVPALLVGGAFYKGITGDVDNFYYLIEQTDKAKSVGLTLNGLELSTLNNGKYNPKSQKELKEFLSRFPHLVKTMTANKAFQDCLKEYHIYPEHWKISARINSQEGGIDEQFKKEYKTSKDLVLKFFVPLLADGSIEQIKDNISNNAKRINKLPELEGDIKVLNRYYDELRKFMENLKIKGFYDSYLNQFKTAMFIYQDFFKAQKELCESRINAVNGRLDEKESSLSRIKRQLEAIPFFFQTKECEALDVELKDNKNRMVALESAKNDLLSEIAWIQVAETHFKIWEKEKRIKEIEELIAEKQKTRTERVSRLTTAKGALYLLLKNLINELDGLIKELDEQKRDWEAIRTEAEEEIRGNIAEFSNAQANKNRIDEFLNRYEEEIERLDYLRKPEEEWDKAAERLKQELLEKGKLLEWIKEAKSRVIALYTKIDECKKEYDGIEKIHGKYGHSGEPLQRLLEKSISEARKKQNRLSAELDEVSSAYQYLEEHGDFEPPKPLMQLVSHFIDKGFKSARLGAKWLSSNITDAELRKKVVASFPLILFSIVLSDDDMGCLSPDILKEIREGDVPDSVYISIIMEKELAGLCEDIDKGSLDDAVRLINLQGHQTLYLPSYVYRFDSDYRRKRLEFFKSRKGTLEEQIKCLREEENGYSKDLHFLKGFNDKYPFARLNSWTQELGRYEEVLQLPPEKDVGIHALHSRITACQKETERHLKGLESEVKDLDKSSREVDTFCRELCLPAPQKRRDLDRVKEAISRLERERNALNSKSEEAKENFSRLNNELIQLNSQKQSIEREIKSIKMKDDDPALKSDEIVRSVDKINIDYARERVGEAQRLFDLADNEVFDENKKINDYKREIEGHRKELSQKKLMDDEKRVVELKSTFPACVEKWDFNHIYALKDNLESMETKSRELNTQVAIAESNLNEKKKRQDRLNRNFHKRFNIQLNLEEYIESDWKALTEDELVGIGDSRANTLEGELSELKAERSNAEGIAREIENLFGYMADYTAEWADAHQKQRIEFSKQEYGLLPWERLLSKEALVLWNADIKKWFAKIYFSFSEAQKTAAERSNNSREQLISFLDKDENIRLNHRYQIMAADFRDENGKWNDYEAASQIFQRIEPMLHHYLQGLEDEKMAIGKEKEVILRHATNYVDRLHHKLQELQKNSIMVMGNHRERALTIEYERHTEDELAVRLETLIKEYSKALSQKGDIPSHLNINDGNLFLRSFQEDNLNVYLKTDYKKSRKTSWTDVLKWSGGERFTACFIVLLATLSASNPLDEAVGRTPQFVILDNPFGKVNKSEMLDNMFKIAEENHIQIIAFSNINEHSVWARFPRFYSFVSVPIGSGDRSIIRHNQANEDVFKLIREQGEEVDKRAIDSLFVKNLFMADTKSHEEAWKKVEKDLRPELPDA